MSGPASVGLKIWQRLYASVAIHCHSRRSQSERSGIQSNHCNFGSVIPGRAAPAGNDRTSANCSSQSCDKVVALNFMPTAVSRFDKALSITANITARDEALLKSSEAVVDTAFFVRLDVNAAAA